jgi:hypothetical protein
MRRELRYDVNKSKVNYDFVASMVALLGTTLGPKCFLGGKRHGQD